MANRIRPVYQGLDEMSDLTFTSSRVQERILRIGVEAKGVRGDDFDQLYRIALKTFKDDRKARADRLSSDIEALFEPQRKASIEHGCDTIMYFYMAKNEEGKPEIFRCTNPSELVGKFVKGQMATPTGMIPRLYRHENEWN